MPTYEVTFYIEVTGEIEVESREDIDQVVDEVQQQLQVVIPNSGDVCLNEPEYDYLLRELDEWGRPLT